MRQPAVERVVGGVGVGRAVGCRLHRRAVEGQRGRADADAIVVHVALLHGVGEVQAVGRRADEACPSGLVADHQVHVGLAAGGVHHDLLAEPDADADGLAPVVGAVALRQAEEVDAPHGGRSRLRPDGAAVHLVRQPAFERVVGGVGVGCAVGRRLHRRAVEDERVRADADAVVVCVALLHGVGEVQAVSGRLHRRAVEGQRVRADAHPVAVRVPLLHGVGEVQAVGRRTDESGPPGLVADHQVHIGRAARHVHCGRPRPGSRCCRPPPSRRSRSTARWEAAAARGGPCCRPPCAQPPPPPVERVVGGVGVSRAVGRRLHRRAVEGQRVRADAHPVAVRVPLLHGVGEVQAVGRRTDESGPPGLVADHQVHIGRAARHVHQDPLAEPDAHADGLPPVVGAVGFRQAEEVDRLHGGRWRRLWADPAAVHLVRSPAVKRAVGGVGVGRAVGCRLHRRAVESQGVRAEAHPVAVCVALLHGVGEVQAVGRRSGRSALAGSRRRPPGPHRASHPTRPPSSAG